MTQTIGEWCQSMVDNEELSPSEYMHFAMMGVVPRTAAGMEQLRKSIKQRVGEHMTDQPDMVNHPPHYTSCPSGIECIEIAELLPFCLGNAYKYLHRAGLKGDMLTDLKKARFYIKRAWLNDEKIHEKAKNRILKVSEFRTGEMKQLLIGVAYFNDNSKRFRPIFCIFDELIAELEHEQAHNSDLDNRPT